MKKRMLFLSIVPVYAAVNLWDEETTYRFKNETDEIMYVAWQSGGGKADTLSGRKGSFTLGALSSNDIQTTGTDCIDEVIITAATSAQKVVTYKICKQKIDIVYHDSVAEKKLAVRIS